MGWLSGYAYRRKCTIVATVAGAQTNYQLELLVGESSGASGEDVDCESHCQDFPNDIRFTKEDGETKHDYWIDLSSLEGATPNRRVSVWIEITSIPASDSVDFYMYYGKSSDGGESNGDDTFDFHDLFQGSELDVTEEIPGGWCVLQDPRAVHYVGDHDRTYITAILDEKIYIVYYDHDLQMWSAVTEVFDSGEDDDHGAGAILFVNGYIHLFWCKHGNDYIHTRISTNTEDISLWGANTNLSGALTGPSYLKPVQLDSGRIYVFWRETGPLGNEYEDYIYSDDKGSSWSAPAHLISLVGIGPMPSAYTKVACDDSKIYIALSPVRDKTTTHNNLDAIDLYFAYMDVDGIWKKHDGTELSLPMDTSTMELVNTFSPDSAWIWDIATDENGREHIVVSVFPNADCFNNHIYKEYYWNGSSWDENEIVNSGRDGKYAHQACYSGGVILDHADPATCFCGVQGVNKTEIQKYEFSAGSWSKTEDITSGSLEHNWRPVVPRDAHSDIPVCWMCGEYNTYLDYDTRIASAKAPEGRTTGTKWLPGSAAFMNHVKVENGYLEIKDVSEADGARAYLYSTGLRTAKGWNPNDHLIECGILGNVDLGATGHQGIIGWYRNNNSSHYFMFNPSGGRDWDLGMRKRESGVDTYLGTCCDSQYSQGAWYNFKLFKTDPTSLKLYESASEKLAGTIANWDEELQIGLQNWNEKTWRWDWIRVRKYALPEPTWGVWGSEEDPFLFLKLLQDKGLNIDLSQKLKGLNLKLSQEGSPA